MLCRRAIKGSFKFKLAIEIFKIINIILLYEEQFYLHVLSWYQETLLRIILHFSVRLFSVPLADGTGLNYPLQPGSPSPFLQPFRRAACVKKPGWRGNFGRTLHQSLGPG